MQTCFDIHLWIHPNQPGHLGIADPFLLFGQVRLNEYVVVKSVVTVIDCHASHDICLMREMVRCESSLRASDVNRTRNYIVDKGQSLGTLPERKPGKEQIIINKRRAMAYFYIQILTGAGILLPMVIMEQVAGNPGSLGLPVQPYPPVAMVDMVAAYHCVDGAVQFDAAQFRAAELPVCIDMMDLIPFNQ